MATRMATPETLGGPTARTLVVLAYRNMGASALAPQDGAARSCIVHGKRVSCCPARHPSLPPSRRGGAASAHPPARDCGPAAAHSATLGVGRLRRAPIRMDRHGRGGL